MAHRRRDEPKEYWITFDTREDARWFWHRMSINFDVEWASSDGYRVYWRVRS